MAVAVRGAGGRHDLPRPRWRDQAQSIEATPAGRRERRCSSNASAGVFHPRIFRGLALARRRRLRSPRRSSATGRCPWGSTDARDRWCSRSCRAAQAVRVGEVDGDVGLDPERGVPDSSLPRSHVEDRRSCSGSVVIFDASAFFIVTAVAGKRRPVMHARARPKPSSRGRWISIVKRVVRSTSVPIAGARARSAGRLPNDRERPGPRPRPVAR